MWIWWFWSFWWFWRVWWSWGIWWPSEYDETGGCANSDDSGELVNSAEFNDPGDSCISNDCWSSKSDTSGDFCESYDLGESVKSVDSWESTD